ncbi:MAG: AraC family transcriptional regulator ligand-binding domain-containing protein [Brevundimonas sp.]|uniref:AraC family transcriptional regulator n=1 Tax=Brevundimonas sp. TaxID=1871086 RepID=UPI00271EC7D4|nr:AraC family transcriptional regulator [Brevundimonas sp.]MDO9608819.1 AraC family transcriptional regulator ligand-binding domain-containing protein [Brevundimonas sp.]
MRPVPPDRCRVPLAFWRATDAMGLSASSLLRQARLPTTLHLTGQAITTAQYFALMRALENLADQPALGVEMIQQAETSVHPPSTLAAFYAPDYRGGLERLSRFKRLCTPEILSVHEERGTCTLTVDWLHSKEAEPAVSIDITFATIIELGRRSSGKAVRPIGVEFARSGPKAPGYEDYFKAPVRFGAARDALILDRTDLDLPFVGHNPELLAMLTPTLGRTLQELDAQSTISDQVVMALKLLLPSGRPELPDVARQLGMSERTLQRRILTEGASFRELLLQARRDLWKQLLADEAIHIDEIAYLLGYQDVTSFYRAFRAWEGVTPAQWRTRNGKVQDWREA